MIVAGNNTQSMVGRHLIMSAAANETTKIERSSDNSSVASSNAASSLAAQTKKNNHTSSSKPLLVVHNKDHKPKKRGRDKKPPGHPKRPLSAYNFFFQLARDRLVAGETEMIFTQEEIDTARAGPAIDPKKRLHRKTHGKVGFKELAFRVGALWKTLDPKYKDMFNKRANVEREKYEVALKHWKRTRYQKQGEQQQQQGVSGNNNNKKKSSSSQPPVLSSSSSSSAAVESKASTSSTAIPMATTTISSSSFHKKQDPLLDHDNMSSSSCHASMGSNDDSWDSMVAAVHDTISDVDDIFNHHDPLLPEEDELDNILAITRSMFDGQQQQQSSRRSSSSSSSSNNNNNKRRPSQGEDSLYHMLCQHTQQQDNTLFRGEPPSASILEILEPRPIAPSSLTNANGDCILSSHGAASSTAPQPELQPFFNSCMGRPMEPQQPSSSSSSSFLDVNQPAMLGNMLQTAPAGFVNIHSFAPEAMSHHHHPQHVHHHHLQQQHPCTQTSFVPNNVNSSHPFGYNHNPVFQQQQQQPHQHFY